MEKPSPSGRAFLRCNKIGEAAKSLADALFRRSRSEYFALLAGFRFWLGFWRFLDFFSAFVFASHERKHDTKQGARKAPIANVPLGF
jgi:hypothetical protein